jgi:hypothetical protein
MKISGFTFIRNGSLLGYPYIESLKSLLMVADEVVVAVGNSADDTLDQIRAIGDPRIRIIETTWNECMQDRGYVYAQQKMVAQFCCSGDWAFYLEGDEVIHEKDAPVIRATLQQHLNNPKVEALAFDYHHFYGSPNTVARSPAWYRKAVRVIRNSVRNYSPDGLFFVVMDRNKLGRYPRAALANVPIYHYGHVRSPEAMQRKVNLVSKYWRHEPKKHDYREIDPLTIVEFQGSHPAIVQPWLAQHTEPSFAPNPQHRLSKRERKHRWLMKLERLLGGADLTRKHYSLVRTR